MTILTPATPPEAATRVALPTPRFLRKHNLQLWLGLSIFGAVVLTLALGPLFISASPNEQDLANIFAGPSPSHWLGTDHLGRDLLARMLQGGRIDLSIALVAALAPLLIGGFVGAIAGYYGGWVDNTIMRLADLVSAFPFYVLIIALVFILGNGALSIFIAITAVSWVAYARIVRGETKVLREKEFIAACKASGLPDRRILTRHVVPNTATQAVVYAMSDVVSNLAVVVTLSFFGLGIVPPTADWGQIMSDGQQYLAAGQYSMTLLPGLAIVVIGFALALVGEGLALKLRGGDSHE